MGAHLAVVSKSGVKLTERGQMLAQALLRFDQEIFAITNDLRAETHCTEGVVRVSIADGLRSRATIWMTSQRQSG